MVKASPEDPTMQKRGIVSICWPNELAFDGAGEFVGFTMPRLDIVRHHAVGLLWNAADRAELVPSFTWKYLYVAAANFCSLMELIHAKGHVIGDVNEENLLVSNTAIATIVDCDSMQVRDPQTGVTFRSPVSREAYISPERLGTALADVDRSPEDDYWALAVLLFSMLMEGQHPANGIGYPPERDRRLRLGIFPMIGERGFPPPKFSLAFGILPPEVRSLFERCFRDGHSHPENRPGAAEWKRTLQKSAAALVRCPVAPLHWFSPHVPSCPWCQERDATDIDRFAATANTRGRTICAELAGTGSPGIRGRWSNDAGTFSESVFQLKQL